MHGCARGPPPVGAVGGRSNPPLDILHTTVTVSYRVSTLSFLGNRKSAAYKISHKTKA